MTIASVMDALGDRGTDGMHTIPASATVMEAVEKMGRLEIGALVVSTEDQLLAGIFTERDVMNRVVRAGLDPRKTREFSAAVFTTLRPSNHRRRLRRANSTSGSSGMQREVARTGVKLNVAEPELPERW